MAWVDGNEPTDLGHVQLGPWALGALQMPLLHNLSYHQRFVRMVGSFQTLLLSDFTRKVLSVNGLREAFF